MYRSAPLTFGGTHARCRPSPRHATCQPASRNVTVTPSLTSMRISAAADFMPMPLGPTTRRTEVVLHADQSGAGQVRADRRAHLARVTPVALRHRSARVRGHPRAVVQPRCQEHHTTQLTAALAVR